MDILQKKELTKYIAVASLSLLLGVLLDHFLIYPHFKLDKNQEICEVQEGEEGNGEESLIIKDVKVGDKTLEIPHSCKINVDVSGALKKPGVYCLEEGSMLVDAITKAGGYTSNVAYKYIARKMNLSQLLVNNQKIYIPFEEEMECKLVSFLPQTKEVQAIVNNSTSINLPTSEEEDSSATDSGSNNGDSSECININTATLEQLEVLNGVGPAMAKKIVEGRPYSKVEDLLNVSGIGEATFDKFKDNVCI